MEGSAKKQQALGAMIGRLQSLVSFVGNQECDEAIEVVSKVLGRAEQGKAKLDAEWAQMETKDLIKEAMKDVTPKKGFFSSSFCSSALGLTPK